MSRLAKLECLLEFHLEELSYLEDQFEKDKDGYFKEYHLSKISTLIDEIFKIKNYDKNK